MDCGWWTRRRGILRAFELVEVAIYSPRPRAIPPPPSTRNSRLATLTMISLANLVLLIHNSRYYATNYTLRTTHYALHTTLHTTRSVPRVPFPVFRYFGVSRDMGFYLTYTYVVRSGCSASTAGYTCTCYKRAEKKRKILRHHIYIYASQPDAAV